jgi:hypothetical protein
LTLAKTIPGCPDAEKQTDQAMTFSSCLTGQFEQRSFFDQIYLDVHLEKKT